MSWIIKNDKTLNDVAIIALKYREGREKTVQKGDFVAIIVDDEIVGFNVLNASKYFAFTSQIKTLDEAIITLLQKQFRYFQTMPFFKIGQIIKQEVHPQSSKLLVLKVLTDHEITIVTNATNTEVGKQVVVAQIGAILPTGKAIKETKVLGIASEGMLCGTASLGQKATPGVLLVSGINGAEYRLCD